MHLHNLISFQCGRGSENDLSCLRVHYVELVFFIQVIALAQLVRLLLQLFLLIIEVDAVFLLFLLTLSFIREFFLPVLHHELLLLLLELLDVFLG